MAERMTNVGAQTRSRRGCRGLLAVALILMMDVSGARAEMDGDAAAALFGRSPSISRMRLSPDGKKVSFLRAHAEGFPVAMVIDLETGKPKLVLSSDMKKNMFLQRCRWANNERLLCGYYGVTPHRGRSIARTRLVAVDRDGKNAVVLAQRQQRDNFATHQDAIVDLLPDEPNFIWIEFDEGRERGVSRVDIVKNRLKTVEPARVLVSGFRSDGRGEVRFRLNWNRSWIDYQYRLAGDSKWRLLYRDKSDDLTDIYWPVAFGEEPNELYLWDRVDGRRALVVEKLTEDADAPRERRVVFSHPQVDLDSVLRIGKTERVVGVRYSTDRSYLEYFDPAIRAIHDRVAEELGDGEIEIVDESWDRRFYLILASSDQEPGTYYRFDSQADELARITDTHTHLEDETLSPMVPIEFPSRDGVKIRGYLTRPAGREGQALPLIVLPHGGPTQRDRWGYDWLVQYFANQGFGVLQVNYRGSGGFGETWIGRGAFRDWRRVTQDIEDGVKSLEKAGVVDSSRICAVGWSFGGYAALMSALEHPDRYRCVVSIAAVTHPHRLYTNTSASSPARRYARSLVPRESDEIKASSALLRAAEMPVPVLLFHGERDLNAQVSHTRDLAKALEQKGKPVEFTEFEEADHYIERDFQRIEMLQRISDFLDEHLAPKAKTEARTESEATAKPDA